MWYTGRVRSMSGVHLSIKSHQTVYHHCYEYYLYCGRSRAIVATRVLLCCADGAWCVNERLLLHGLVA
jgi:hypothetical protein